MQIMEGEITGVSDAGLAYVRNVADGSVSVFTFDKIIGYRGEYPRELKRFSPQGLRTGVGVRFTVDAQGRVLSVVPVQHA